MVAEGNRFLRTADRVERYIQQTELRLKSLTEVMLVEQRMKDLDIRLDGKKLKQRDSCVYLGGASVGMAIRTPKMAGGLQQG